MRKRYKGKKSAVLYAVTAAACIIGIMTVCDAAYASEEVYATISVSAADDESGVYQYALDSTEDSAWQSSNTFHVQPGTTHTVYVKDAAGNITSEEVYAEADEVTDTSGGMEPSAVETDPYAAGVGAGSGTATVTDYVNDDSKEYYTVTTKNGNNFYLIIDHRSSDNNVYFTKPVSELDLLTLAAEAGEVEEAVVEQAQTEQEPIVVQPAEEADTGSGRNIIQEYLPYILLFALLCGGYYYFMIYKKKKAAVQEYDEDAADMEQFIPVEDDDDSALFSYKGNTPASVDEEDDLIDEFYGNNSEMEEYEEYEAEEDPEDGFGAESEEQAGYDAEEEEAESDMEEEEDVEDEENLDS